MVARTEQTSVNSNIKLLPQEQEGQYKFSGPFVATATAIAEFGHPIIIAAYTMLLRQVKQEGGIDYLQVFEINSERLWFIDDVSHVTCLLPSDY